MDGQAALDDAAVVFASTSNHGNPSTVVYRPLASWAPNSEWQVPHRSPADLPPISRQSPADLPSISRRSPADLPPISPQVQFEKGEEALAIALGHKFAVVATDKQYVRVFSHTGAP